MGDKFHLHGKTPSGDFLLSVNDGPIEEVSPTMLSLMRKEKEEWQSFRREAAKDAMTGMMANADFWKQVWSHNRVNGRCDYPSEIAHFAISCADELIKALQNG